MQHLFLNKTSGLVELLEQYHSLSWQLLGRVGYQLLYSSDSCPTEHIGCANAAHLHHADPQKTALVKQVHVEP